MQTYSSPKEWKMKEKIAKIIQDGICSGDSSWDEITIEIIKAMREPTEHQLITAFNKIQVSSSHAREIYTTMIDSILND